MVDFCIKNSPESSMLYHCQLINPNNTGDTFTSHKYLLSCPLSYERKNKKGDNPSTAWKWVAELRFGKCRQAYFFLKGLRHYWQIGICQPIFCLYLFITLLNKPCLTTCYLVSYLTIL